MSDWQILTLGDIFEISSSKRVLQSDWQSSGVPFYRAREIVRLARDGEVDNELFISEELFAEFREKYGVPEAGDLMVSAVGTLGACYVVGPNDRFYYKDASVLRFKAKREICPRFFQHAFRTSEVLDQVHAGSGSTVGTYTIERANLTRIRVPTLSEQRRIATILDKADALRSKRREAVGQLDRLAQSIFVEMFGDPVTNPKGWRRLQLGEIFGIARGGSPRPIDDYITDAANGVNWVMIGDTEQGGKYIRSTKKKIRPEGVKRSRLVKSGDFLLTNSMSFGRPYILKTSGCIHDGWLVLSPRIIDFNADYFYTLLGSQAVFNEFSKRASGATVKNLNIDLVSGVEVAVPPLDEQLKFAKAVEAIEALKSRGEGSASQLDRLFGSLQARAFSGEL